MSRHGECAEIRSLKRKVPEIDGINDPQSFVNLMKKSGFKAEMTQPEDLDGKMVKISVPEKGLDLIFVKESLCERIVEK